MGDTLTNDEDLDEHAFLKLRGEVEELQLISASEARGSASAIEEAARWAESALTIIAQLNELRQLHAADCNEDFSTALRVQQGLERTLGLIAGMTKKHSATDTSMEDISTAAPADAPREMQATTKSPSSKKTALDERTPWTVMQQACTQLKSNKVCCLGPQRSSLRFKSPQRLAAFTTSWAVPNEVEKKKGACMMDPSPQSQEDNGRCDQLPKCTMESGPGTRGLPSSKSRFSVSPKLTPRLASAMSPRLRKLSPKLSPRLSPPPQISGIAKDLSPRLRGLVRGWSGKGV